MKFPLSWLKDFVDIDCTVEELAEKLSLSGTEVEEIIHTGSEISGVITAKIVKIENHPNADKLVITQVTDGNKEHQIVTGAQNVFEGAIVPISLPGAVLAGELKIKKGKLRGVSSNGMICSKSELGINDDTDGIWVLPDDTPIGKDAVKYTGIKDTIFDISILPNRGDCQSIIGLAREIATILKKPLKETKPTIKRTQEETELKIENKCTNLCPIYTAQPLKMEKSTKEYATPLWIQRRLQLCDIKTISLPVDITNYVLIETGQPLHAFDADKLEGNTLIVKKSKSNQSIITLDSEKRELPKETIIITDKKNTQAIAGIMGGTKSEVTESTQNIIIEAALFDSTHIRKTATTVGLRTDSSIRFEKGIDINTIKLATERASQLFQEITNATIIGDILHTPSDNILSTQKKEILFDHEKINDLLGTSITEKEQLQTLQSLGFSFNTKTKKVNVPSWRLNDIKEITCLSEEIARLIGYDKIQATLPKSFVPITPKTTLQKLIEDCHQSLKQSGFKETISYPMISERQINHLNLQEQSNKLRIQNPLSEEYSMMRPSLLPSLLKLLKTNSSHQQHNIKCYEIGATYTLDSQKIKETQTLGIVLTGNLKANAYTTENKKEWTFHNLKEILTTTIKRKKELTFKKNETPYLHPVESLDIYIQNIQVGKLGIIHPQIQHKHKLPQTVGYIELCIDMIANFEVPPTKYIPIPKTPSTRRDLAIVAPKNIEVKTIEQVIKKHLSKVVREYKLFDLFESTDLGENKKSIAYAFTYQDRDKSLSDEEVNTLHQQFTENVLAELPACHIR